MLWMRSRDKGREAVRVRSDQSLPCRVRDEGGDAVRVIIGVGVTTVTNLFTVAMNRLFLWYQCHNTSYMIPYRLVVGALAAASTCEGDDGVSGTVYVLRAVGLCACVCFFFCAKLHVWCCYKWIF